MTAFLDTARKPNASDKFLSWEAWKEKWNEETDVAALRGLLHTGFQTNPATADEEAERLRFFMRVIDGYWSDTITTPSERTLAHKAFTVLSDHIGRVNVFRERLLVMPPEIIDAVLYFFRPKTNQEGAGLVNLRIVDDEEKKRDHATRRMNEELLQWCEWVWYQDFSDKWSLGGGPVGPWRENEKTLSTLEVSRMRILPILHAYGHGQLEKLLDKVAVFEGGGVNKLHYRVRWDLFTEESLAVLQRLALTAPGVKTLEEALVAGSSAAKVFFLVKEAQKHLK